VTSDAGFSTSINGRAVVSGVAWSSLSLWDQCTVDPRLAHTLPAPELRAGARVTVAAVSLLRQQVCFFTALLRLS
jgi:hypothetical protein